MIKSLLEARASRIAGPAFRSGFPEHDLFEVSVHHRRMRVHRDEGTEFGMKQIRHAQHDLDALYTLLVELGVRFVPVDYALLDV